MLNGKTPDITTAQIAAVVGWVVAQAVAYGVLPTAYSQVAVSAGATIVAAAWKLADAHLRGKRAIATATVQAAERSAPPVTALPPAQ